MDPNNYFLRRDFTLQVIPQILRQNVLEFCWMTSRLKILRTKLPRLKSPRSKQWPERHDCIRNLRRLKWVSHFPSQNYRNSWCSSRSKQTQGKNMEERPCTISRAFSATRPTFAASATCAMPETTVQKMMGAMIIFLCCFDAPKGSKGGRVWPDGEAMDQGDDLTVLRHTGAHKRWLPGEEIKMGKRSCLKVGINSNRDWNDGLEACFYILHPKLKSDL